MDLSLWLINSEQWYKFVSIRVTMCAGMAGLVGHGMGHKGSLELRDHPANIYHILMKHLAGRWKKKQNLTKQQQTLARTNRDRREN